MSIRKAAALPSPVAQYRYSVQWSPEDLEFVATVLEFPSLSWLGEDQFEALRGIERLVSDVIAELGKSGEPVPQPIAAQTFSGRLNLRVPRNFTASWLSRPPITECPSTSTQRSG
ncbi:putative RNase H-like HicB family nuclease [Arthrobacter sp. 754]